MTLDRYLLFVAGSVLLVVTPGPDMAYLLARTIAQGWRAGVVSAVGFNLGGYFHLALAMLGISALVAASPGAFTALKWVGAAYLIHLGVDALRAAARRSPDEAESETRASSGEPEDRRTLRTILWQAFLSDALNPKVLLFFLAFLPQFVDPGSAHPTLQVLLLGITVNMIALMFNVPLVFVANRAAARVRASGRAGRYLTAAMGLVFVALGIRIAFG